LKHHASPDFWACFSALPQQVQELARKNFELLKQDPTHPSLLSPRIYRFVTANVMKYVEPLLKK
jgi:hypothetical protein